MRGPIQNVCVVVALGALVAACATSPQGPIASIPSGGGYKVGEPYEVNGVWYYPREQPDYDETGTASWYGPNFEGQRTANGEVFDGGGLTAAHTTLPMPVNVRVTNLENGRSLVLRVNDRGPFVGGRIIDVSEHAAEVLGFHDKGTAKVRVTLLARADVPGAAPVEAAPVVATAVATAAPTTHVQMAALDPVQTAPLAPPSSDAAPATPPVDSQSEPAAVEIQPAALPATEIKPSAQAVPQLYVQAGAFGDLANAQRLCAKLAAEAGELSISSIDRAGHQFYRVRIGPFDDIGAADAALARLVGLGSTDAKIVVDR